MQAKRLLLLFDNSGKDYVARIQTAVSKEAGKAGFAVTSFNAFESSQRVEQFLAEPGIAGVILTPPYSDDRHLMHQIERMQVPLLRIAPMLDLDRGAAVVMDEYDASRAITDYLIAKGHRRIGFVRGPKVHLVSMRRYNGYTNALGTKGIRVDQSLIADGDFTRASGKSAAERLFALKPTAIFASNDEMAVGVLDAARTAGIRVPDDLSVVGYDDNPIARGCSPRLTTVRQPLEQMGEGAARSIIRLIGTAHRGQTLTIPYDIVERESVRACLTEGEEAPLRRWA